MVKFTAIIQKLGINPVVDVPERALKEIFKSAERSRGPIPVRGSLNGNGFIQTLVKYRGIWRLYINGPMLKASGLAVGDRATIEVDFDTRPRPVPMPPKLAIALKKDVQASAAFDRLTPTRKKDVLRYLGSLKTSASLDRNIQRLIAQLRED